MIGRENGGRSRCGYLFGLLCWGLQSGWNDPGQYKVFWYASWCNGERADGCLTKPAVNGKSVLTGHGVRLKLMNEILGTGPLASFEGFKTEASLSASVSGAASSALEFKVGDSRTVLALLIDRAKAPALSSAAIHTPISRRPSRVDPLDATGAGDHWPSTVATGM
jgi:hypothetical protein